MTQLARVFVALNLILAAGFLFSAATILSLNNDWMGRYETAEREKDELETRLKQKIAAVEAERNDFHRANDQLKEENENLKGTNAAHNQQIQSLTSDVKARETANNEMRQSLDNLQATAEQQGKHVERLETENKKNADDARKARTEAKDARAQLDEERKKTRGLQNDKANLEKTVASQGEDIKHKDIMIDYAREKGINFENLVKMDPVRGAVVNADNDTKLAVINVGKNAGVKRGYVLDVTRGGSYIARLIIDTVYEKAAAGTIKFTSPGESVRAGDQVTNTLN